MNFKRQQRNQKAQKLELKKEALKRLTSNELAAVGGGCPATRPTGEP
jgi:hypothetical protein